MSAPAPIGARAYMMVVALEVVVVLLLYWLGHHFS